MMAMISTASIALVVSMFAGFGFTIGALIALKVTGRDIKK